VDGRVRASGSAQFKLEAYVPNLLCPSCGTRLSADLTDPERCCPRCLLHDDQRIAMAPSDGRRVGGAGSPNAAGRADGRLGIVAKRDGTVLTISLHGELDLSSVEIAEAELAEADSDPQLTEIVLDLEGLEFIDSSGIAWLVDASNRSRANSNRLQVRGDGRQVRRLLELTGVKELLDRPA